MAKRPDNKISLYELKQFYPDSDLLPFDVREGDTLEDLAALVHQGNDGLFELLAHELCAHHVDKIDLHTALNRLMSIRRQLETVETAVRSRFLQYVEYRSKANETRRRKRSDS